MTVDEGMVASTSRGSMATFGHVVGRPWTAAVLLVALLGALTFVTDGRGFLGTDTGGKVATVERMLERGDWRNDVGYWAEEHDPDGDLHPLYYTSPVGDQWVNATSMPMLVLARPLYDVGGYQLALLLPIVGSAAAAMAARALAERITPGTGPVAFWLTGLAGPLAIYALDFWEHSIGVALIGWAVVLGTRSIEGHPVAIGAGMGLLLGAAATMRTESVVYAVVVVGGVALHALVVERRVGRPLVLGTSALVGFGLVSVANSMLERALVGSAFRADRTAGTVGGVGEDLALRAREALTTGLGLFPSMDDGLLMIGVALCAALVWLALHRGDDRTARLVAVVVVLFYLLRLVDGLGFVPGMVAAAPVAVVAVVWGRVEPRARLPLALALAALPLVWIAQYTGGAVPQWAGRYILPSTVILTAVGAACLPRLSRVARAAFVGLSVVVTAFGLMWVSVRTHAIADHGDQVVAHADGALVSDLAFWLRELGAFYESDRPWLTGQGAAARAEAIEVLEAAGFSEFDLLHLAEVDAPEVPGYSAAQRIEVGGLPGVRFVLTRFVAE